jgi:hypothetical protein
LQPSAKLSYNDPAVPMYAYIILLAVAGLASIGSVVAARKGRQAELRRREQGRG